MVPVARLNLLADKARFLAAIAGVAFAVMLILLVQGLYEGYRDSLASFVEDLPADLWVLQSGSYDLFHSSSILAEQAALDTSRIPGVAAVQRLRGKQTHFEVEGKDLYSLLLAFEPGPGAAPVARELGLDSLPSRGEIVLSDYVRRQGGLSAGDQIEIAGVRLTVREGLDVKSPPFGSFSIISYEDAEAVLDLRGQVSYVLVATDDTTPSRTVKERIESSLRGVSVYERTEFARVNSRNLNEFLPVIGVLLVVSYLVGTVVTSLTIYTTTIEKTREFGVLKAIGAGNAYVYRLVVFQSLMIGLVGFLLGLPLAVVLSRIAEKRVAEFITDYEWTAVVFALIAVVLMGLTSALLPARRVAGIDPASVFRA